MWFHTDKLTCLCGLMKPRSSNLHPNSPLCHQRSRANMYAFTIQWIPIRPKKSQVWGRAHLPMDAWGEGLTSWQWPGGACGIYLRKSPGWCWERLFLGIPLFLSAPMCTVHPCLQFTSHRDFLLWERGGLGSCTEITSWNRVKRTETSSRQCILLRGSSPAVSHGTCMDGSGQSASNPHQRLMKPKNIPLFLSQGDLVASWVFCLLKGLA